MTETREEAPLIIEFDGPAYIRPMGRGILLGDLDASDVYLDEIVEDAAGGDGHVHLRVRIELTHVARSHGETTR